MMKLHWSPRSPYVRIVCAVAHEKHLTARIEYIRSVVAMTAPNAALMRVNPLNKIPTLVLEDGRILYDSRTITQYFDAIGEGPLLYPTEERRRFEILQLEALGHNFLDALILWRNELNRPPERRLPELLSAFELKFAAAMEVLEAEVPRLSNLEFSAGHVSVATALSYLDFRFSSADWRNGRPALADWYASTASRPSMQATEPRDDS